jgi:hydrogenase maturation protein HypF
MEYDNPEDRRFHAQPNACPQCGPEVTLQDRSGHILSPAADALRLAAGFLKSGRILAVKGLGGFHLMVDACNEAAVALLRYRKQREEKPLALMYPSVETVMQDCLISTLEERFLRSPECPIVLLARRDENSRGSSLAPSIAPGNPYLGVMLPYTPLHHLRPSNQLAYA